MKKNIQAFVVLTVALLFFAGYISASAKGTSINSMRGFDEAPATYIDYTKDDLQVIPDKYNTGCKGKLTSFVESEEDKRLMLMDGLPVIQADEEGNGALKLSFYKVKELKKEGYVVKNVDFTSKTHAYRFYFIGAPETKTKITFENCKFTRFDSTENADITLKDCTVESVSATNLICNNCQFGHSVNDAIRAFNDAYFTNCFICDMQYPCDYNQHIDGVQIFGNTHSQDTTKGKDAGNIHFKNCRFEIPVYYIDENNLAGMNDCIFVQNEYSDASNITFEDIITNGANYQFSAHRGEEKKLGIVRDLKEVSLKNCRMGEGSILGIMTSVDPYVKLEIVGMNNLLYVGSSWKDEDGFTHFSVTNDCAREKKLTIVTDKQTKTFTIPAYPLASITNAKTEENKHKFSYESFPIDIDVKVEADEYAVCYDTTYDINQIRYVNYSQKKISINESELEKYKGKIEVIKSGSCGKNITYTLTNDGVLTLTGEGRMEDYHSKKLPPWDRKDIDVVDVAATPKAYIRKVVVGYGITYIGAQSFNGKGSLQKLVLPETLEKIGGRAFANCSSIIDVTLPASLGEIGTAAFTNCFAMKIDYKGDDWSKVKLAEADAAFLSEKVNGYTPGNTIPPSPTIQPGNTRHPSPTKEPGKTLQPLKTVNVALTSSIKKIKSIKPRIKKIKRYRKKVKLIFKKEKIAKGYHIYVSKRKNFKKSLKKYTLYNKNIKGYTKKNITKTIKGLRKKQKYYIKVRAFIVISGKKYYSKWSATRGFWLR